jgi:hypothetical protein
MSLADLRLRRALSRLGKEGDAASATGSLHARLEEAALALGSGPLDGPIKVAPDAAVGVSVTAAANAFGAWTQVWAAGVSAVDRAVVAVYLSDSLSPWYGLRFGVGSAGAEVVTATRQVAAKGITVPVEPFLVAAGERLAVALASSGTLSISSFGVHYVDL